MPAPWASLLGWWFGDPEVSSAAAVAKTRHSLWFGKRVEQDQEAANRFGAFCREALDGGLEHWCDDDEGWLALILLLDQVPRMIYRDQPAAFSGDARALRLVETAQRTGRVLRLSSIRQVFACLPLEHAESLPAQDASVRAFRGLRQACAPDEEALFDSFLDYAERHREVIVRFGRFPHRNQILGRDSSEAERAYLAQPGAGF